MTHLALEVGTHLASLSRDVREGSPPFVVRAVHSQLQRQSCQKIMCACGSLTPDVQNVAERSRICRMSLVESIATPSKITRCTIVLVSTSRSASTSQPFRNRDLSVETVFGGLLVARASNSELIRRCTRKRDLRSPGVAADSTERWKDGLDSPRSFLQVYQVPYPDTPWDCHIPIN